MIIKPLMNLLKMEFTALSEKFNSSYETVKENDIPSYLDDGVIKDEIISLDIKENGTYLKTIELRKIGC